MPTIFKNKIFLTGLKLSFAVVILTFLITNGSLDFQKITRFWEEPQLFFGLFLIIAFWTISLSAIRWRLFLKSIGLEISVGKSYLLTWIGNFFNTFLPGGVSGDLIKGFYVIKEHPKGSKAVILLTLLIDRVHGLFGVVILSFGSVILKWEFFVNSPKLYPFFLMIIGLFVGMVVFYLLVFYPFQDGKDPFIKLLTSLRGGRPLLKIYKGFKLFQDQKQAIAISLCLSILIHGGTIFVFYQIGNLLHVKDLDWQILLFILPLGLITTVIPLAPGGIGVGHAAFGFLYSIFGITIGADIFNLFVILQLLTFLCGGIPYVMYGSEYKATTELDEPL